MELISSTDGDPAGGDLLGGARQGVLTLSTGAARVLDAPGDAGDGKAPPVRGGDARNGGDRGGAPGGSRTPDQEILVRGFSLGYCT
ncbi:hypothetical protein GCM10011374_38730 [Kocuria dechangensis]|uniref:Uncharacterized protein n=1 Tax=Kocuria dechangensis TaxID=1176249 RepID=A0A917H7Z8_9MICC|nr:hypothetical protein GCM10011374_38730 [Kocuria dechangensis]